MVIELNEGGTWEHFDLLAVDPQREIGACALLPMTSIVAGFLALGARSPLAFALAVAPTQRTVSLSPTVPVNMKNSDNDFILN